jgi:hypothetical protein
MILEGREVGPELKRVGYHKNDVLVAMRRMSIKRWCLRMARRRLMTLAARALRTCPDAEAELWRGLGEYGFPGSGTRTLSASVVVFTGGVTPSPRLEGISHAYAVSFAAGGSGNPGPRSSLMA